MSFTNTDLIEAALACDLEVRSYSGRGMCGRQCVGIVADDKTEAVAALIEQLGYQAPGDERALDLAFRLATLIRAMNSDSMGRRVVIYWPGLKWPADQEAEQ